MESIILAGFGGHARSVADTIEREGKFSIAGYTDNEKTSNSSYRWLGTDEVFEQYYQSGILYAAISIGYMGHGSIRDELYKELKNIGFQLPVVVDPSAVIARDVQIGEGTFIGKGAVINSGAKIGKMCIINSGALIEHDNQIGDYTHIAVRAVLCGDVQIGSHSFIGANATVVQGVQIENRSFVKAGSVITQNSMGIQNEIKK